MSDALLDFFLAWLGLLMPTQDGYNDKRMELDQDSRLMLLVRDGDRQAFATLFRRHSKPLHHFVCRFVGNASVAEELVQEIFFKIYRAADNYQPRGRFTTFLYRVATNHCLNEVRRADYRTRFESIEQSGDDKDGGPMELPDSNRPNAETLLWGQRLGQEIQAILNGLPENQRAALLLHRLEGLSYQDIAEALELSVGAVKSLIHRAKKTLKQQLDTYEEEQGESENQSATSVHAEQP